MDEIQEYVALKFPNDTQFEQEMMYCFLLKTSEQVEGYYNKLLIELREMRDSRPPVKVSFTSLGLKRCYPA